MQRYSKKRQAILDCLRSTTSHPTAEWIFTQLKPDYPDLSLATVYRNLGQMKEAGVIQSMGTVRGQERFDANILPHTHAVCTCCGVMVDVMDVPVPTELIAQTERSIGFTVTGMNLLFSGICCECQERRETDHKETLLFANATV